MRILITGGAGFLGSHLAEALIQQGHCVICMDNLSTGRVENISHLMGHDAFSFVKYNVCDYVHVEGVLDAVMHFASPASPQDYLDMPIATLKVGGLGTHKVLGLAKAKHARFLLASTSEVYGDPLVNPQPESYWGNVNPISPRGVYDETKRFAEAITMAYHRYHGLDTRDEEEDAAGDKQSFHGAPPETCDGTGADRAAAQSDTSTEGLPRSFPFPHRRAPTG